jgi:hypothetical protein
VRHSLRRAFNFHGLVFPWRNYDIRNMLTAWHKTAMRLALTASKPDYYLPAAFLKGKVNRYARKREYSSVNAVIAKTFTGGIDLFNYHANLQMTRTASSVPSEKMLRPFAALFAIWIVASWL